MTIPSLGAVSSEKGGNPGAATATPFPVSPSIVRTIYSHSRVVAASAAFKPDTATAPFVAPGMLDRFMQQLTELAEGNSPNHVAPYATITQFVSQKAFNFPELSRDNCLSQLLREAVGKGTHQLNGLEILSVVTVPSPVTTLAENSIPCRDFSVFVEKRDGDRVRQFHVNLREIAPEYRDNFMSEDTLTKIIPLLEYTEPDGLVSYHGVGRTAIAHVLLEVRRQLRETPQMRLEPAQVRDLIDQKIMEFESQRGFRFLSLPKLQAQRLAIQSAIEKYVEENIFLPQPSVDDPMPDEEPGHEAPVFSASLDQDESSSQASLSFAEAFKGEQDMQTGPEVPAGSAPPASTDPASAADFPLPHQETSTEGLEPTPIPLKTGFQNVGNSCFLNGLVAASVASQGIEPLQKLMSDKAEKLTTRLNEVKRVQKDLEQSRWDVIPQQQAARLIEDLGYSPRAIAEAVAEIDPVFNQQFMAKVEVCKREFGVCIDTLKPFVPTLRGKGVAEQAKCKKQLRSLFAKKETQTKWESADFNQGSYNYMKGAGFDRLVDSLRSKLDPEVLNDLSTEDRIAQALFCLPAVAAKVGGIDPQDPRGSVKVPYKEEWERRLTSTLTSGEHKELVGKALLPRLQEDFPVLSNTAKFANQFNTILLALSEPKRKSRFLDEAVMRPFALTAWELLKASQRTQQCPSVFLARMADLGLPLMANPAPASAFVLNMEHNNWMDLRKSDLAIRLDPTEKLGTRINSLNVNLLIQNIGLTVVDKERLKPKSQFVLDLSNIISAESMRASKPELALENLGDELLLPCRDDGHSGSMVKARPLSMVVHLGANTEHGHYIALSLADPQAASKGPWRVHDDNDCSFVADTPEACLRNRASYTRPLPVLIVYEVTA